MAHSPQLVGRRYRLVERLGTGGTAVVWRAYDEVLHRPVAVKLLSSALDAQPGALAQLRVEALAAAKLSHPHLTSVYDYGEQATTDGHRQPYLVMEVVEGTTLSLALRAAPQGLGWRRAVEITAQAAGALAAAHARGIVHRDVSPANIMLTAQGVKVVDFGICALSGTADEGDELVGTVDYIAPERIAGTEVTAACDVYALGLVLYRCLTGSLPWPGGTAAQRLRDHVRQPPQALPPIDGLPPHVAALCMACLAKDPAERPTAADLATRLGTTPAEAPAAASGADRESTQVLAMPSDTVRLSGRPGPTRRAALRPKPVAATAALLAAGLASAVMAGGAASGRPPAAETAEPPELCEVTYDEHVSGDRYAATVTVASSTDRPGAGWRLTFTSGGDRMLAEGPARLLREGRQVSVTAPDGLAPGRPVTVKLTGARMTQASRPADFALDGRACRSTTTVVETTAPSPRTTGTPADVDGRGGGPGPEQHKGKGKGKGKK
ncbi:protein kinase [Catellatospora sp. KI3]|uniref:protein kinase domain-containing protein n=1 Tax=Catellatospora sp. KI3 TaxID=3041620 RepID=UPI002482C24D|nr:protein kinase [Catellatospora sp. KI3]MDI1462544.1 protein kinase [Catellatospora sp. KI3]